MRAIVQHHANVVIAPLQGDAAQAVGRFQMLGLAVWQVLERAFEIGEAPAEQAHKLWQFVTVGQVAGQKLLRRTRRISQLVARENEHNFIGRI